MGDFRRSLNSSGIYEGLCIFLSLRCFSHCSSTPKTLFLLGMFDVPWTLTIFGRCIAKVLLRGRVGKANSA